MRQCEYITYHVLGRPRQNRCPKPATNQKNGKHLCDDHMKIRKVGEKPSF